jgi:hypothetical protein
VKQDLKHFRHSLDDNYMLWRSGYGNLIIYDVYEHSSDEIITNFWIHQNEVTKPISAIATADANRVLGIGVAKSKSSIVHYYERNDQQTIVMSEIDRRAIDPLGSPLLIKLSL